MSTSISSSAAVAAQCGVMPEEEKFSEYGERWLVKEHQPRAKVIPNPASGQVLYDFSTDVDGHISIKLINSLGITVRIVQASIKAGQNSIPVNYEDIAQGIYRYQLSGALTTSGKLVIIR